MINPVTNGAMRPGSVDTATKVLRIALRCAAGATVAMMDDKIGMVTPMSASVKKMTEPSVEAAVDEQINQVRT
jgi:hypothetical protein